MCTARSPRTTASATPRPPTRCPDKIIDGGPVIDARNPGQAGQPSDPGPQDRHHLRRRPGPHLDAEGPRRAEEVPRARRLLRDRDQRLALPGPHQAHGRRGPRGGPAHLQPPRPVLPVEVAHRPRALREPARARGRRRRAQLAVPAAVLLLRRRHGQRHLAGRPVRRQQGLRRGARLHRQRGLAAAGRQEDHSQRHPGGRQGRHRPDARLRRRPLADRGRARQVPAGHAGVGLHLRQPHRPRSARPAR